MTIYLGADHRGFNLKEYLKRYLAAKGYQAVDLGNAVYDKDDDYPNFAKLVAEKISANPTDRGILICGSGAGMAIVANKFPGVRAALAVNAKQAFMERNDEDVNVLSLTAEFTTPEQAEQIVEVFLKTPFSTEERHRRRVGKIE